MDVFESWINRPRTSRKRGMLTAPKDRADASLVIDYSSTMPHDPSMGLPRDAKVTHCSECQDALECER